MKKKADTVVIDNGIFTYVGKAEGYTAKADDEVIDLGGKFVIPGLIDSHQHWALPCVTAGEHANPMAVIITEKIEDALAQMDEFVKTYPDFECYKLFEDRVLGLEVDEAINPKVFWAAGKLFALSKLTRPMVMVDLDLIVWKNIDDLIGDSDVYGIHREHIRPEVYPDKEYFKFKNGYEFPEDYDWDALPLNTALLYIKDIDFIHKYADKAIDFMYHTDESNENLKHMVFAEQRLLPILAAKYNKSIKTMFDVGENIGYQEYFTHVWGHKNILKYNDEEKQKFCITCS